MKPMHRYGFKEQTANINLRLTCFYYYYYSMQSVDDSFSPFPFPLSSFPYFNKLRLTGSLLSTTMGPLAFFVLCSYFPWYFLPQTLINHHPCPTESAALLLVLTESSKSKLPVLAASTPSHCYLSLNMSAIAAMSTQPIISYPALLSLFFLLPYLSYLSYLSYLILPLQSLATFLFLSIDSILSTPSCILAHISAPV